MRQIRKGLCDLLILLLVAASAWDRVGRRIQRAGCDPYGRRAPSVPFVTNRPDRNIAR